MKLNIVGIVGGILAFVTIALPWWIYTASVSGITITLSWYTYGTSASTGGTSFSFSSSWPPSWAGYGAMALVIIGGLLAIVGSVLPTAKAKLMLLGGGILDLLSLVVFVLGFNSAPSIGSASGYGLIFSSQSISGVSFSSYLYVGFWLALVAAILSFVAIKTGMMGMGKAAAPTPPSA